MTLFLLAALAMPVPIAAAAEKPYRVSLVGDAYTGDGWVTGVRIELAEGWKTYWRMPGDSGIPPQFTWTTSVPAGVEVAYPLPHRFADASGESVGYKEQVIFPVTVKAGEASAVTLSLDLFLGVCREVCIPAQASAKIELGAAIRDVAGSNAVSMAMDEVPQEGSPVTETRVDASGDKPVLRLKLAEPADDIFVETVTSAYFRKPLLTDGGRTAELPIDNLKDADKLRGTALTITVSAGGRGLEQVVTLP